MIFICKGFLIPQAHAREASRMVAVVEMEFGGEISVTESVTEELQTNGKVIPKYPLNGPRREKTIELLNSGNADVTNDHVEEGLIRSKRLRRLSSSTSTNDHPRTSYKRLSCRGEKNAPNTEYAKGGLEAEDEVECSDKDTNFSIGDSSQASFESLDQDDSFVETYESSKPRANITTDTRFIDLTNSDFDSDILFRRMVRSKRNKHTSFETEPQISESSKTPHCSSSHEILSPSNTGQVENLLKLSSEDLNIDDVEMDEGVESLRNLLSVHQKISVSNGEEEISDSDSGEGDNGNQETFSECGHFLVSKALFIFCRGSEYAEFFIDEDEFDQLRKSARALESQFRGTGKDCQNIAAHHSKTTS